jgi:hypothetical protein
VISFTPFDRWELLADGPPLTTITPIEGSRSLVSGEQILAIPSEDDPQATVYRDLLGRWNLERAGDDLTTIQNKSSFQAAGSLWIFHPIECTPGAIYIDQFRDARRIHFQFSPTLDENQVLLEVGLAGSTIDRQWLPRLSLLFSLAQRRLWDAKSLSEPDRGWADEQELIDELAISKAQVNIDIFRIRKRFCDLNVVDAGSVIERRCNSGQLRLGVDNIRVLLS